MRLLCERTRSSVRGMEVQETVARGVNVSVLDTHWSF